MAQIVAVAGSLSKTTANPGGNFHQLNRMKHRPHFPGQPWIIQNPRVVTKWKGHIKTGHIDKIIPEEVLGVSHKGHLSGIPGLGDWGSVIDPNEAPSIMLNQGMSDKLVEEATKAYLDREPHRDKDLKWIYRKPFVD